MSDPNKDIDELRDELIEAIAGADVFAAVTITKTGDETSVHAARGVDEDLSPMDMLSFIPVVDRHLESLKSESQPGDAPDRLTQGDLPDGVSIMAMSAEEAEEMGLLDQILDDLKEPSDDYDPDAGTSIDIE